MLKQNLFRGYSINVNMKSLNKKINTKAVFNQKDYKTAMLVFNFSMDGNILDITGCKVIAKILKNDDTRVVLEAQVLDAENGLVAVGLGEQALACVGQNDIELIIQYNDQQLYSPKMTYIVSDNLYDEEELVSTSDVQILRDLLRDVSEVESNLLSLTNLVNVAEGVRKDSEETRISQENLRQESIKNMKSEFDAKVKEVKVAIDEMGKATVSNVEKLDDKISDVDNKIQEVNSLMEQVNSNYNKKVEEIDAEVAKVIKLANDKIKDINNTIKSVNSSLDAKLTYVDNQVVSKFEEVDNKIQAKFEEMDNTLSRKISVMEGKVDSKLATADLKIKDVESAKDRADKKIIEVDTKISETNSKISEMNSKISEVNEKVSGYTSKYNQIDEQEKRIKAQEQLRQDAEVQRKNTFDGIIAELEISQKDIDDILGMVGGI